MITPDLQRLILLVESTLHHIVRGEMSREDAVDIKGRIARPIGLLNQRHGLRSESAAKDAQRQNMLANSERKP